MEKLKITRVLLCVVLATIAVFQVSCSKDDEDGTTKEQGLENNTTAVEDTSAIVGYWLASGTTYDGVYTSSIKDWKGREVTYIGSGVYRMVSKYIEEQDPEIKYFKIDGSKILWDGTEKDINWFEIVNDRLRIYYNAKDYYEYTRVTENVYNKEESTEQVEEQKEDVYNKEESTEQVEEQNYFSVSVMSGEKYAFSNAYNEVSGWFTVLSVSGKAGSKVVVLEIISKGRNAKETKGEFTLGDDADHTSFLMWNGTTYEGVKQTVAVANAKSVIFALDSSVDTYTITSATINAKIKNFGATETRIAKK